jgi:cellulose synthase/poly-beta-1,6-N-acetylglucosamine synthase-like glycosyltransferase
MSALEMFFLVVALLLLVPLTVLLTESLAALLPGRRKRQAIRLARPRCAVLIPAHNEEASIAKTLTALLPQLQPEDHLVVVADNCSDRTAENARACGATVIERKDAAQRGKGFALDFGVRFLEKEPPEVVILVDADCLVTAGSLEVLAQEAHARGSPVQAVYLMEQRPGAGIKDQLSSFAFQFKNLVRPLGLDRLGVPCLLTGTGIAFPWPLLQRANLASGNIVEDMQLGIDLAVSGQPPRLCGRALVLGELPAGRRAAVTQRTRWEHGHMRTLLSQVPRLLWAAIRQRRFDLMGLALELSVPPLSMLGLLWACAFLGSLWLWWYKGPWLPATLLGAGGLSALLAILGAWIRFGRERLPLASLLAAPFYVMWKVPIYLAFVFRPQRAWIRTERNLIPPQDSPSGK